MPTIYYMKKHAMCDSAKNIRRVSLRTCLNQLFHASKESSKKRALRGRLHAGEHDISLSFLENIWHKQNGRCNYSNIEMNYNKHEWKVSLERIDTSKGYTQDNVVLCCQEFNTRSQWSISKIEEMTDIIGQNIECVNNEFICKVRKPKYDKVLRLAKDGKTYYKCTYCNNYKSQLEFKRIGEICRKCVCKR
jgi:hypothetical protein